jgi:hypothetical protein
VCAPGGAYVVLLAVWRVSETTRRTVIDYIARDADQEPSKVWLNARDEETFEGKPRVEVMVRFPFGDVSAAECTSLRRARGVGIALAESCGCEFDDTVTGG